MYWNGAKTCVTGFHLCYVYASLHQFQAVAFDQLYGTLCPNNGGSNPLRNVLNASLHLTSNKLESSSTLHTNVARC